MEAIEFGGSHCRGQFFRDGVEAIGFETNIYIQEMIDR